MGHFDRIRPVLGLSPFGPTGPEPKVEPADSVGRAKPWLGPKLPPRSLAPLATTAATRSPSRPPPCFSRLRSPLLPPRPPRDAPFDAAPPPPRRFVFPSLLRVLSTPPSVARVSPRRAPPHRATASPCPRAPGRLPLLAPLSDDPRCRRRYAATTPSSSHSLFSYYTRRNG